MFEGPGVHVKFLTCQLIEVLAGSLAWKASILCLEPVEVNETFAHVLSIPVQTPELA